ncbi:MAG TPA: hypothetical protein VKR32_10790, partial [Puia sp.]|nr:hypothetical protein [Puia sp.]
DTSYVLSQSETVVNGNLTFINCYLIYHHYIGPNSEINEFYWFVPNIGMVKNFTKNVEFGVALYRTFLLRNYRLP